MPPTSWMNCTASPRKPTANSNACATNTRNTESPPHERRRGMSDKEYRLASAARSGLLYMRGVPGVALGDRVVVRDHSGRRRNGQVIRTSDELVLIQVLEGTDNLDLERTLSLIHISEPTRLG